MKVFIIPSWYKSKKNPLAGVFFHTHALALKKQGLKPTIAYVNFFNIKQLKSFINEDVIIGKYDNRVLTYKGKFLNILSGVPGIGKHIVFHRIYSLYKKHVKDYGKPDIINAHSCLWGGWAAYKLSIKENIPYVVTEHTSKFINNSYTIRQQNIIRQIIVNANKVVTVGEELAESVKKIAAIKVEVIPNSIDFKDFTVNPREEEKTESFTFFSLAFLNKNKGMDILIKAFTNAYKGKSHYKLEIGGDGPERVELVSLIKELGMEEQITILGSLNRKMVSEYFQKCDCFVLASKYETFGVAFIEAMASGKPVISTKCGEPENFIKDFNGLLVQKNNIEELTNALIKITSLQFNNMAIRDFANKKFSVESVGEMYKNLYKKVLDRV
jgi:L-malate glycosyltransferase